MYFNMCCAGYLVLPELPILTVIPETHEEINQNTDETEEVCDSFHLECSMKPANGSNVKYDIEWLVNDKVVVMETREARSLLTDMFSVQLPGSDLNNITEAIYTVITVFTRV